MKNIAFFILVFLSSCDVQFQEKELYGVYAPVNYKNTFDTIQLKPQGTYHRKVFNKNNKLVLEMNGKWSLENNTIIHFDSYFLNLDRDIAKFPALLKDTSGGGGGRLEFRNKTIQFCVGYHEEENCYQKIK